MNLKPTYDHIVVKRNKTDSRTPAGLYIPDKGQEKPNEGDVVAVGIGKQLADGSITPLLLKEGDRVLFSAFSGSTVKFGDVEYVIMKETDVLATVQN